MSENQNSELAEVIKILVNYMNGKGQLPRLDKFIILKLYQEMLEKRYKIPEIINWHELVQLSIHAPPIDRPLWLHALAELTKINQKTEIVSQNYKKKPLLGGAD